MKNTILSLLILVTCFSCSTDDDIMLKSNDQQKVNITELEKNIVNETTVLEVNLEESKSKFELGSDKVNPTYVTLINPSFGEYRFLIFNKKKLLISYALNVSADEKEAIRHRYDGHHYDITHVLVWPNGTETWVMVATGSHPEGTIEEDLSSEPDLSVGSGTGLGCRGC